MLKWWHNPGPQPRIQDPQFPLQRPCASSRGPGPPLQVHSGGCSKPRAQGPPGTVAGRAAWLHFSVCSCQMYLSLLYGSWLWCPLRDLRNVVRHKSSVWVAHTPPVVTWVATAWPQSGARHGAPGDSTAPKENRVTPRIRAAGAAPGTLGRGSRLCTPGAEAGTLSLAGPRISPFEVSDFLFIARPCDREGRFVWFRVKGDVAGTVPAS